MIKYNNSNINNWYIYDDNIIKVYFNNDVCYHQFKDIYYDYSQDYLTFVAIENGTFSFSGNDIDYSVNGGETWTTLTNGTNTPSISAGSKIMWKASGLTPTSGSGIGTFSSTGRFNAQGNVMSMHFSDNFRNKTSLAGKTYAFRYIFSDCLGINDAKNLILPATTLAGSCYASMFGGCSGLTSAPVLPATTMAGSCYQRMFQGCSSLTTPPRLPATSVIGNCYQYMFDGCTSLRTAPELPATTMAIRCYQYMFRNCSSLTTSPSLPAATLAEACYGHMFENCTNLSNITCLATDISANGCTNLWLNGVASEGTFTKAANMEGWSSGTSGVPTGWTVYNYGAKSPIDFKPADPPKYIEEDKIIEEDNIK